MKQKTISFISVFLFATFVSLLTPKAIFAVQEAGISATPTTAVIKSDPRVEKLRAYLASHNSPLALYAHTFVKTADAYNLDYRLVPAIAGVESTFGKKLPKNSYNAYGWNGGKYAFENWETGIDTVSKSLREKYMNKWGADTVVEIARYYCPPSKTWAGNVTFFMKQIELGPKQTRSTTGLKLAV